MKLIGMLDSLYVRRVAITFQEFARWLSRSPGDANDIVQEAVLNAYRTRRSNALKWSTEPRTAVSSSGLLGSNRLVTHENSSFRFDQVET